MDLQKIKGLIDLLAESRLVELELIEGDEKIRLVKAYRRASSDASEDTLPTTLSTSAEGSAQPVFSAASSTTVDAAANSAASESQLVCAPMFGIVHLTPAPGEPPFVGVGDAVEEGQALCTIEAMKMFNAIESEFKGAVVEILVKPGDEVEAGQPLFRIGR